LLHYIVGNNIQAQRRDVVIQGDALGDLKASRVFHPGAQLGLAHQEDLHPAAVFHLEVAQHPDLFQGVYREVSRFVDDQKAPSILIGQAFEVILKVLNENGTPILEAVNQPGEGQVDELYRQIGQLKVEKIF
jgi:hypothetical protein